jgi:hypothetical protein
VLPGVHLFPGGSAFAESRLITRLDEPGRFGLGDSAMADVVVPEDGAASSH